MKLWAERLPSAALVAGLLAFAGGCSGSSGSTGPAGPAGAPAPPTAPSPGMIEPGIDFTVVSVDGASGADGTFQPGDTVSFTYTLTDGDGQPFNVNQLDRGSVYGAGPSSNYNQVLARQDDLITRSVFNADGSWTYTFADPLPQTYLPPYNDSNDIQFDPGARRPELTGMPLLAGTYTIGVEVRRDVTDAEGTFRDVGNAVGHFLFGGATQIALRGVVADGACNQCHDQIQFHGGNRRTTQLCVLCHTTGAEDRPSGTPSRATPGLTIDLGDMIHAIHRGVELPRVAATANGADPFLYAINARSLSDFSHVAFPFMPGGTGFNEQTRNCETCHGGAAEPTAYYQRPSRKACGACHDDVNFADGTRLDDNNAAVSAGTLTRAQLTDPAFRQSFHPPQADDSSCIGCHTDNSPLLGVRAAHRPALLRQDAPGDPGAVGIFVLLQSTTGGTGPNGSFLPGDTLMATFDVRNGMNMPIDAAGLSDARAVLAGPTGNYQKLLPPGNSTTVNVLGQLSGNGPFTVSVGTIPATYPAPLNDSKRANNPTQYPGYTAGDPFTFAGGSGELKGQPLQPGTYTVMIYAARQFTRPDDPAAGTFRETSVAANADILISTVSEPASVLVPYAGIISDQKCNTCHGDLRFHGNSRRGVKGCILCHTSGAEDRRRATAATPEAPEPDTIDFRVMIHKLHYGEELSVVRNGGSYDLVGFSGIPDDFNEAAFPVMPGGAASCVKCHANDAWKVPTERDDVRIWQKACLSCHDSTAARAHAALNTFGDTTTGDPATTALESCAVCHGEGRDQAVEKVHRVR